MSEGRQWRVCVLGYRPHEVGHIAGGDPEVIVIALMDEAGSLRFLVNPDIESIVLADDLTYIQSLLEDFIERAKYEPRDLFKQLCSLGVGPLVTKRVLTYYADYESMSELILKLNPL